jgi:hypothetical protein
VTRVASMSVTAQPASVFPATADRPYAEIVRIAKVIFTISGPGLGALAAERRTRIDAQVPKPTGTVDMQPDKSGNSPSHEQDRESRPSRWELGRVGNPNPKFAIASPYE